MKKDDVIEKAVSRQVGDHHPSKPWVWTEYKPGKFDWRPDKNKKGDSGTSSPSSASASGDISRGDTVEHNGSKKKVVGINNGIALLDDGSNVHLLQLKKTSAPSKPSSTQVANAKVKSGKAMNSQQLIDWAKKTDDSNLVKVANGAKNNAQMRKIAYDALEARGYDMSKIDTSGTLDDMLKLTNKPAAKTGDDDGDDTIAPSNSQASVDIDGDDDGNVSVNGITEKWYLNKNDDRVKKMFNLKTKEGRIKYDQFVYAKKKKEKDYMPPVEVVQDLNEQYLEFLDNDEQRFMISAGGAGIGKSYGFNKIAELLNKRPFGEGDTPGDGDYDIFEAPEANSGKQLQNILKAHNGKIIVFDDNDKVLTRADCASVMKKATATTGTRIIGDPDDIKSNFEFTGRIMIMTNKDLATLSESEDTKAIISRAMMVSEIYMTVPETIQVMESRYQDYEFKQAPRLDDEGDDKKEREDILALIKKNQKNIDPAQFTTRTFQEMLISKRKVDNANAKRSNAAFASLIGSADKNWEEKAVAYLTKSFTSLDFGDLDNQNFDNEDIQKANDYLIGEEYLLLSQEEGIEKAENLVLEEEEELTKGAEEDDMTLEKAESLLLD